MNTLYIIGNGFDIAHGLNTSYWSFRTFLENKHPYFLTAFEELYNIRALDDSEPWYTSNMQDRWNKKVNNALWSTFEESLGNPDTTMMLHFSEDVVSDLNLESGNYEIKATLDCYWQKHYGFINHIQEYLEEWINEIETTVVTPQKTSLFKNKTSHFINFNYTDTLERVYQIDNVLHIHGSNKHISHTSPIIGHCNEKKIATFRQDAKEALNFNDEGPASILSAIANYLDVIYKDTESIIYQNHLFFEKLNYINYVIIFGWSIGEVDLPYLKQIKNSISTNSNWIIYYYNADALKSLQFAFQKANINPTSIQYILSKDFWD